MIYKVFAGIILTLALAIAVLWWRLEVQTENAAKQAANNLVLLETNQANERAVRKLKSEAARVNLIIATQQKENASRAKALRLAHDKISELRRNDEQARKWSDVVMPGSIHGVLLDSTGNRARDPDREAISTKVINGTP